MEGKDLQGRFGVRIVRRLEPQVLYPHLLEERLHESYPVGFPSVTQFTWKYRSHTNEVSERQPVICNDAFDLVEFGQMGRIGSLIPEHAVDAEHLDRLEPSRSIGKLIQQGGR